ncbi:zinc finger MYM-type 1-like [Paramuricea clavata]|uniref:Zinc finger MYM-type 1-like n=1 Tax=Paramuricea clavata TaxID=317549 RepID=A0A7D9JEL7_PARCT|nr:zinc finger MYM-type 1-like [Paramuricea clavata]
MDSARDPASESTADVERIMSLGPVRPKLDFPRTTFGGKSLRFQERWYSLFDWLEYSVEKDATFCFCCRIFGNQVGCSGTVFVKQGFRNWKKAVGNEGKLEKHSKSRMHQLSRERAICRKTYVPINAQLSAVAAEDLSRRQQEKKENREVAEVIFDVVRHIILQNEAFGGHDEKDSSLNQGKFLAEIKFLAKYHPPLQKWLDTYPGNVLWLSPDIQNEMIEILANHILDIIKMQVKESKYYSVECDEVTSHKHSYMSIVLRYVFNNIIYERMIGLKEVVSLTGKSLWGVLVQELGKLQIPLCNMVGKGFDGASNMSGKEKGMQQQLTDAGATLFLYFHCFAHCLNLVLEKCAETLQPVKDVFSTIGAIYKVMEGSPQRNAVYERKLELFSIKDGRTALRAFSDTRWTAKEDNLNATINTLPCSIDCHSRRA